MDTVGNLADNHPVHHTARLGTVAVTDRARSVHCCIDMKTVNLQTVVVARSTDRFSLSLEAKNRCRYNKIIFFIKNIISVS